MGFAGKVRSYGGKVGPGRPGIFVEGMFLRVLPPEASVEEATVSLISSGSFVRGGRTKNGGFWDTWKSKGTRLSMEVSNVFL